MAVPEYREFYLRAIAQTGSASPDKESGFPVKEIVVYPDGSTDLENNRFLTNHFPSEKVYKKLFESITFKLNSEDTASVEQQGLVRIAIGQNIVNRKDIEEIFVNGSSRKFTTVVVPSELPIVSAGTGISVNVLIRKVSDNSIVTSIPSNDRDLYYIDYQIINTVTPINNVGNYFNVRMLTISNLSAVDSNDNDSIVLGTHFIQASQLITDVDMLSYKLLWFDNSDSEQNGTLEIYIGTDNNINNCYKFHSYQITNATIDNKLSWANLDIEIYRDGQNGFLDFIKTNFYKSNSPLQVTPGTPPNTFTIARGELYSGASNELLEDSKTADFNAVYGNNLIDWNQIMHVHFRYKMNGGVPDDFSHNVFNIIGKTIKNS